MRACPRIGVLALQGAFREHIDMLESLGACTSEVRLPGDLSGIDGLIIPGGESTSMGTLMGEYGLIEPLRLYAATRPVLGTCAGLVLLAARTTGADQPVLGVLDVTVCRNAFGRQVRSFEGPVELNLGDGPGERFHGIFIRAPLVEAAAAHVEVIATHKSRIVGVRQGSVLGVAFHPELGTDKKLHEHFLGLVAHRSSPAAGQVFSAGAG